MTRALWFPTAMLFLQLAAAGVYLYDGNMRMAWYWMAAAVLTVTVTF